MAEQPYRAVLLFGAPGVGKGTQGKILGVIPGFLHLSMGDVFRSLDKDSELGKRVRSFSSHGELVPDDITLQVWAENVAAQVDAGKYNPEKDILLLDGIPRNLAQANLLDQHIEPLRVIHLAASDQDAMVERLRRRAIKEKRADDANEDLIRRRWDVYRDDTQPVLDHYPRAIIAEIDAIGTPAEVLQRILSDLVPMLTTQFGNVFETEAV
jgi:adenylate kinase